MTVDPGRVKGTPSLEFAKTLEVPMRDAVADRAKSTEPPPGRTSIDRIEVPRPLAPLTGREGFDWHLLRDFGTGIGEDSARWYADAYVATGRSRYLWAGRLASLWTPDTYVATVTTLWLAGEADLARRAFVRAASMASALKHVFLSEEEFLKTELRGRNSSITSNILTAS